MALQRLLPASLFAATVLGAAHPMITPAPSLEARQIAERGLDDYASYAKSLLGSLGSDVSSYVISGVPQYFQDFPTGDKVESSLGIDDSQLAALPTQVLNLPAYANWTDQGWNVRVHGNVYKQPNTNESKLNDLANVFLIGTSIDQLQPSEQDQARNLTAEIFVVQQRDVNVTMNFRTGVDVRPDASGGVVNAKGGNQSITLPYPTTDEGDFDTFIILKNTTGVTSNTTGTDGGYLLPGNETSSIQALNMYANGSEIGNATAYLVPPTGFTIVNDIDDILRITKIYEPKEGLLNSFARAFTPWQDMPEIYANWSATIPDFHFHYLTTTPEQVTRNYMDFIFKTYPLGSFDTRPLNFSDVSATLSIRKFLLDKIFQTFPQRKFVLMADTSNSDVMKDYPQMVKDYPGQVQCIFLRNTTATDSGDLFPYDTSGFKGIDQEKYMFFVNADDLRDVDIVGGNCWNKAVKQNVTFEYQGRGFGNSASGAVSWNPYMLGAALILAMVQFAPFVPSWALGL
ncbi:Uu.00g076410.m01.CDS01 [Anthostomella pinea]|uniref:Uu.00g076410.m01.CDS01 n=1 Tax=Anthostomella pinea TaxID=933095 RepID=A0AAI8VVV5_9PEZI|nr:Uu.00g076410.m01.CDS01 [Anthostomella pinea]